MASRNRDRPSNIFLANKEKVRRVPDLTKPCWIGAVLNDGSSARTRMQIRFDLCNFAFALYRNGELHFGATPFHTDNNPLADEPHGFPGAPAEANDKAHSTLTRDQYWRFKQQAAGADISADCMSLRNCLGRLKHKADWIPQLETAKSAIVPR